MSEAEALEVAGIFAGNAITAFSVYITFTMAYLVASYYVGERLTGLQTLTISVLFTVAATSAILSLVNSVLIYGNALAMTKMGAITPFSNGQFWAIGMSCIGIAGIGVSYLFMWQVRHPKTQ